MCSCSIWISTGWAGRRASSESPLGSGTKREVATGIPRYAGADPGAPGAALSALPLSAPANTHVAPGNLNRFAVLLYIL